MVLTEKIFEKSDGFKPIKYEDNFDGCCGIHPFELSDDDIQWLKDGKVLCNDGGEYAILIRRENRRKFSQFIDDSNLSFSSPITKEEWDRITDVEFERTEEVTFCTPNGKEVQFRKVKHGEWIENDNGAYYCSLCQSWIPREQYYYARYCLHCGADMKGELN